MALPTIFLGPSFHDVMPNTYFAIDTSRACTVRYSQFILKINSTIKDSLFDVPKLVDTTANLFQLVKKSF